MPRGNLNVDPDLPKKSPRPAMNIFERTFNRELVMEEDEVPIVLYELHENSLLYMDREEWDKALILLNKAQSIVEVGPSHYSKSTWISTAKTG